MNDETKAGATEKQPRGTQRDSMLMQATLRRRHDAQPAPVRIRNLSAGGMMAECALPVSRGEAVEIDLRNVGILSAVIAWSVDGRIGIAFDTPIDHLRVRRPVAAMPARAKPALPQSRRPGLRTA